MGKGIQRGTGTEEATQELREGTVGWEMQLGLVLTRKIRGQGLVSCGSRHAREMGVARNDSSQRKQALSVVHACFKEHSTGQDPQHIIHMKPSLP